MKNSMPPIINENCTILILGSLPGEESLKKQEYYAHPQNSFWKIIFSITKEEFSTDYEVRCKTILKHNIALWDVIHSADRNNSSLDSKIKNPVINDFKTFLNTYPNINKILINGGKASDLFKRYVKDIDISVITMPSTSPANARMKFNDKLAIWESAINN